MPNENAHVGSSDAITEFRAALLTFQEEAQAAVETIEMKAGQTLRFLDEDAANYWDAQIRTSYDDVNAARIALTICRTKTIGGRKSSCIEERKALARTKDRLDLCRRQKSVTNKTAIDAHDAADEFRARISHLHRMLDSEVPKLQALLHRISVSLDAYTATRPPMTKPFESIPASDDENAPEDDSTEDESTKNESAAENETSPNEEQA